MKTINVSVGISNRHVHLTKEVYESLFHDECLAERKLNQPGEYVTSHFVTLKGPKGTIEHVRVMGPTRVYNQVEVSYSDAFELGVNPPVVRSGNLENAEDITIIYENKEIVLEKSCIIAESHLHMNPIDAKKMGFVDKQIVPIKINSVRKGTIEAFVKITPNGFFELHIDRDQANCFLLKNNNLVEAKL